MWGLAVGTALRVLGAAIPEAEARHGKGQGQSKAAMVMGQLAQVLPEGVDLSNPRIAGLVAAKIAADVALANALESESKRGG